MARTKTNSYDGIHIWSNKITLTHKFCDRFVKENKFVSMKWDSSTGTLELTFHPLDGVDFRVPVVSHPDRTTIISHAKFFAQLRPFKTGRYNVADIDISPSGTVALKFKLKK